MNEDHRTKLPRGNSYPASPRWITIDKIEIKAIRFGKGIEWRHMNFAAAREWLLQEIFGG